MTGKPPRAPLPPTEPVTDALRELAAVPRWVCWRYEWVGGRWTKVPYRPSGQHASTIDPRSWSPYRAALDAAAHGEYDGVGYVVYRGEEADADDVVAVDLDHCVSADGVVAPAADAIVEALGSYAETTPSGAGLRVFVRGTLPVPGAKADDIELYQHGRYVTVTGEHLSWSPREIRSRQDAL